MFGNYFYHSLVKKHIVIFGTLFNDIQISRPNQAGDAILQSVIVPLSYGPREKFMARNETDPNLLKETAIKLPRIAFEVKSVAYDGSRKLSTTLKRLTKKTVDNKSVVTSVYQPVPYNIEFEMNIITKTADDANQIVEQIIPFFTPDWTVTANLLDDFDDYHLDIQTILTNVSEEDTYEGDFKDRRTIIWTLNFTMKGWFFGPVSKAKQIKIARVNLLGDTVADNVITWQKLSSITAYPGLTANGQPTNIANNAIDPIQVQETDNYDYVVTLLEYPNTI